MNTNTYHHWKFTLVGGGVTAIGLFLLSASYLNSDPEGGSGTMNTAGVATLVLGLGIFAYGVWSYLRHQPEEH